MYFVSCSEIEFTLRFGCDVPTHIDQGVRLEIDPPDGNWAPIRFYTPTLTPAPPQEGKATRVQLEPGGTSVLAVAGSYNSSLPLIHLNDSRGVARGVVIREYLCGSNAVNLISNSQSFRLRWMQRYLTNPQADVATWSLDNIRIRLWNKTCFRSWLSEDFNSPNITTPTGLDKLLMRGKVTRPSCMNDSVAYFNQGFQANMDIRRSLLLTVDSVMLGACENLDTTYASSKSIVIQYSGLPLIWPPLGPVKVS